jgi:hypothetical protein
MRTLYETKRLMGTVSLSVGVKERETAIEETLVVGDKVVYPNIFLRSPSKAKVEERS